MSDLAAGFILGILAATGVAIFVAWQFTKRGARF